MPQISQNEPKNTRDRAWLTVAYVVVFTIAIDCAIFLSITGTEGWIGSVAIVFAVALIGAGTLFSVGEMLNLGR